jgi:hypothetical protein
VLLTWAGPSGLGWGSKLFFMPLNYNLIILMYNGKNQGQNGQFHIYFLFLESAVYRFHFVCLYRSPKTPGPASSASCPQRKTCAAMPVMDISEFTVQIFTISCELFV